jgi:hypothetical protein
MQDLQHPLDADVRRVSAVGIRLCDGHLDDDQRPAAGDGN